jgi:hypothetical protein
VYGLLVQLYFLKTGGVCLYESGLELGKNLTNLLHRYSLYIIRSCSLELNLLQVRGRSTTTAAGIWVAYHLSRERKGRRNATLVLFMRVDGLKAAVDRLFLGNPATVFSVPLVAEVSPNFELTGRQKASIADLSSRFAV